MTEVLSFLNDYWYLLLGVFYIITLVINIISAFKYKTSINLVQFKEIFDLVNEAEQKFPEPGSGAQKLAYVISKASIKSTDVIKLVEMVLNSPEEKK